MTLTITIDLDNAIFEDDGIAEVERLLQSVASRVPDPLHELSECSLHESNGNYCGSFKIE